MRFPLVLAAVCATLAGGAAAAAAQAHLPASSPHPVILVDAYLDYANLLLTPPRSFDLLASSARSERAGRLAAFRDFERGLRLRTAGVVGEPSSTEERRAAKRRVLTHLGNRLEGSPAASIVRHGRVVWQRIEDSTNFDIHGYRVRLRVGEAVEGKLALKVQKRLS